MRAFRTFIFQNGFERVQPLLGFLHIRVGADLCRYLVQLS